MAKFFPEFDEKFEWICEKIPLLPNADLEQMQADILALGWSEEYLDPVSPKLGDIKKLLLGIQKSTDRHLAEIRKLYTAEMPNGPDEQVVEEFLPARWITPIFESLENTKLNVDEVLSRAPKRLKSGKTADTKFIELTSALKSIFEKYTGNEATTASPSAGEPTMFSNFANACFIALGRESDVIASFEDKLNKAMVEVRRGNP